ncbi:hypothetical protein HD806DRAFT_518452 [Xylariaceae sp. AK1471]|nr:hypothetical protein HD806DRAFT_518452 [Xylariaceae sp. AK1471]
MTKSSLPSWIGIILHILTLVSFVPQCYRIIRRRDCSGISLAYASLNAFSFTEELVDGFVYFPPLKNWIDFIQIALPCAYWSTIFVAVAFMPSRNRREIGTIVSLYVIYVLLTVLLIIALTTVTMSPGHMSDASLLLGFIVLIRFYLHPIVTIFGLSGAALAQADTVSEADSSPSSLSTAGLIAQAATFAVQAIFWPWRMPFTLTEGDFPSWYVFAASPSAHSAVYSVAQMAVWVVAVKQRATAEDLQVTPETEPLLYSQATAREPLVESG